MIKVIREILKVFYDNGLFDEGVELIGSWCFQLYQKHLGAQSFPLITQDIDFLIPNPFRGKNHSGFIDQLENLGFNVDFKSDGSIYLWNAELKIEFITPEKGRGTNSSIKIRKLGINAIPLRFVALLCDNPVSIVEDGMKILVPRPANFCLHKLIVASRRKKVDKYLKDLQQAICTSVIVDKAELLDLFNSLPKKWRVAIIQMVDRSKDELPLLSQETEKLERTLQNAKK
ncbi:MAG: GSU2403 family nucleotidyltransferase fold protein [Candidatus Omnitrophota bacterium]